MLKCIVIGACLLTLALTVRAEAQEVAAAADAGVVAEATPDPLTQALLLEPTQIVKSITQDAKAGRWRYVASGVLALLMFGLAKARGRLGLFRGDRGGAILVGILGLLGGLVSAFASSEPINEWLFLGAAGVTWTAVGGVTWFKRLLWPKDATEAQEDDATEGSD